MTIASRMFARAAKLAPPSAGDVTVQRDLETKTADGTILLGDRWYSPSSASTGPVILIRTPYGRRQFGVFGRLFAERGYQVLIQSCRGTFGSGGGTGFAPFHYERGDGLDTLSWLAEQPWYPGSVATFGPSYMGMTQWAVAGAAPPDVGLMAMQVTASNFRDAVVYPGGSFTLETGGVWMQQLEFQERGLPRYLLAMATGRRRLRRAYASVPLSRADTAAFGRRIDFFQEWLVHDRPGDPYWAATDFSADLENVPPTTHVAGWYDLFLPAQIGDFVRLRAAGRDTRLTIGPWTHTSRQLNLAGVSDALDALSPPAGGSPARPTPVRLHVGGRDAWVDLEDWPPPSTPEPWYLHPGRRLSSEVPAGEGRADRYLYDPADPTPSCGGATLDPFGAGPKDQKRRETRSDVVSYTSSVLSVPVTVAGPVTASIAMRCSRGHFDVFVRLCDVDGSGRSVGVCDGILRCTPEHPEPDEEGVRRITVGMWPTARTFLAGHRIRLQVSSAAHPLFARNTGSGEPLGSATHLFPSAHEIFTDAAHPSYVTLPVSPI